MSCQSLLGVVCIMDSMASTLFFPLNSPSWLSSGSRRNPAYSHGEMTSQHNFRRVQACSGWYDFRSLTWQLKWLLSGLLQIPCHLPGGVSTAGPVLHVIFQNFLSNIPTLLNLPSSSRYMMAQAQDNKSLHRMWKLMSGRSIWIQETASTTQNKLYAMPCKYQGRKDMSSPDSDITNLLLKY